jgi:PKD repeat protein
MLPSRKRGPSPLGVQFNNCSTGTYKKVLWDFGDGAQSDLVMPSHTYAQPGTYKVTLVLTDTVGKEYTSAPVEIVVDPPQPTFP